MILVENGPEGCPAVFREPRRIVVAHAPHEVLPALEELDRAQRQGAWLAGWIGYEGGMALEPRLRPLLRPSPGEPLLAFGVYSSPVPAEDFLAETRSMARGVRIAPFTPLLSREEYDVSFGRLADYIRQGDCYQVNLTFPLRGRLLEGTAAGLYGALARVQPVGHGAFVDLGVGPAILSRSPELFFSLDREGLIETRPMKGTAPRHPDPIHDRALAQVLAEDEKTRAENLMIVDLLRNDIARVARIGSVRVTELFKVEPLETVHQMTSHIVGKLSERLGLAGLMPALFPCGSVTGAPKIRAMEIIAELEPHPRGIYCGSIGWMAPDGSAAFNVAIRTLRLFDGGELLMNVGGGVVHDSTAEGEWEEALWKARFADPNRVCG